MINRHYFYAQPMYMVYAEMFAMYLLWTLGMMILRGKAKRIVAAVFAVFAVGLIVFFTVWGRESKSRELSLIPFISFVNAKTQPEFYRTMYMNVALFIPLGLSLPYALPDKIKHKVLLTVGVGFVISVGVEAYQYFFSAGRCETDDVLMNTLGTFFGANSFLLHNFIFRLIRRLKYRRKHD